MIPPMYRIVEVAIYSLLNFLPFMILALYPFRNRFRFSKNITFLLILSVTTVQVLLGLSAAFLFIHHVRLLSIISTLLYASFYFFTVKDNLGKTLFTLLMLSNFLNLIMSLSKCIEGILFGDMALELYRWSFSLCMLITEIMILLPLYLYISKSYAPIMEKKQESTMWRYMWAIPATFYIMWFFTFYGNTDQTSLQIALRPLNSLILFLINLGEMFVYSIIIKLFNEQTANTELAKENHLLEIKSLQYKNLSSQIEETRKARHDLRHHNKILAAYAENGDIEGLRQYLYTYIDSTPDYSSLLLCNNHIVNTFVLYFAQQAKENDIDFEIKLNIPEKVTISDNDLAVLFGNLLENAVYACKSPQNIDKRIVLHGKFDKDSLLITIDNTFCGDVKQTSYKQYMSTKHEGIGIGLESVKAIVEKYHGSIKIEQQNGIWMTSVILNV